MVIVCLCVFNDKSMEVVEEQSSLFSEDNQENCSHSGDETFT